MSIERYAPGFIGDKVDPAQLQEELYKLQAVLNAILDGYRETLYAPPSQVEDGMIVIADGTTWNPGSGAGAYERKGGAWVKL